MTGPQFIRTPCDTCHGDGFTGFGPWCLRPKCYTCDGRGGVVLPVKVPTVPCRHGSMQDDPDYCPNNRPGSGAEHTKPDPACDPDQPCDVCYDYGTQGFDPECSDCVDGRRTAPIVCACDVCVDQHEDLREVVGRCSWTLKERDGELWAIPEVTS